ncbi:hypothetical protein UlMin_027343 [Ulmus minor]
MDPKFKGLPPHKRFRLIQQDEQRGEDSSSPVVLPCLPAKKRKETRETPIFPDSAAAAGYCLPAKKRVWALPPDAISEEQFSGFDLNMEYKPPMEEEDKIHKNISVENSKSEEDCEEDDGIVCAVCQSTDGDPSDPIVFCDGCDLMVHASCYGDPLVKGIPEGDWFCCQCSNSKTTKTDEAFSCCLCPVKGGAMKRAGDDGKWAHIVCALYVPEVFFRDPDGREGIDFSKVLKSRWQTECYLCKTTNGCAISCSEPKCCLAFHVTCGLKEDLCLEYREGKSKGGIVASFCKCHTDIWKKEQQTGKFKIVAREEN